jgi:hypothetical protein
VARRAAPALIVRSDFKKQEVTGLFPASNELLCQRYPRAFVHS